MPKLLRQVMRDERGSNALEYALILGIIFLAIMGAASGFAAVAIRMLNRIAATVAALV